MHERFSKTKDRLRGGAAVCLSAMLLFPICAGRAHAVSVAAADAVSTARELVPVGHTIGIKLFARGVLVVGLSDGETPAKSAGLEKGDVILKCNGTTISSTEQFQSLIQTSGGKSVDLQVRRETAQKNLAVTPKENDQGGYAIGAWIRDSMAGIGTMTFYDPTTGVFGALGHGISDTDTAQLMPFSSGSILPSTVKAVKKGAVGAAGELRGNFDLETCLGDLYANTDCGIFGTMEGAFSFGKAVPVASASEVQTGKATILSNIQGDDVREYEVEITRVFADSSDPRDLLLTVTDPELLALTGGIVQGMSGSPILQNGKLIGAVTHVLLNDPTRGYGIFIENMLENASLEQQPVA